MMISFVCTCFPCVCTVIGHRIRQNLMKTSVTHSAVLREPLTCIWRLLSAIPLQMHGNTEFIIHFGNFCWSYECNPVDVGDVYPRLQNFKICQVRWKKTHKVKQKDWKNINSISILFYCLFLISSGTFLVSLCRRNLGWLRECELLRSFYLCHIYIYVLFCFVLFFSRGLFGAK